MPQTELQTQVPAGWPGFLSFGKHLSALGTKHSAWHKDGVAEAPAVQEVNLTEITEQMDESKPELSYLL